MTQTITISPGITLRGVHDDRFKQGCLSFQIIRPMNDTEAAVNALLPAVLLRGTTRHPDLRSITLHLDDLYGASVGSLVRRVGDYQTTGLYCGFIEDRFALPGDKVLEPMMDFLRELLLEPVLEKGGFKADFVESEKKNLISTIESQLNDKRAWAMGRMLKIMCKEDSYGVPRLGEPAWVAAIDPVSAYEHYRKILRESRIDVFYVGSAALETVAKLLMPIFEGLDRNYQRLPGQTAFSGPGGECVTETKDVAQGKLCMGLRTPITLRDEGFVAMQLVNLIFGAGMTSKLFMNIREKMSLCYDIGSGYYGSKGIMTVSAGIDFDKFELVRQEVMNQLRAPITEEELNAAKEALRSGLRTTHDSPGAMEGYYGSAALSGLKLTPAEYMQQVDGTTLEQVEAAARTLELHTTYFLKGDSHEET